MRMEMFSPLNVVNAAWAFATVDHSDTLIFEVFARVTEQYARHFKLRELASAAWAFAKADHSDAPLFEVLFEACKNRFGVFDDVQHIAESAMASDMLCESESAAAKVSPRTEKCMDDFKA